MGLRKGEDVAKRKRQGKRKVAINDFWKTKTKAFLDILENVAEVGAQICEVEVEESGTRIDYASASVEEIRNHEQLSQSVESPFFSWWRLGIGSLSTLVYPAEHRAHARTHIEKPEAGRPEPLFEKTLYAKPVEVVWTATHTWTSTSEAADGICGPMVVDFQLLAPHEVGELAVQIMDRLGKVLAAIPQGSLHWRPAFLPKEALLSDLAPEVLAACWLSTERIIEGADASTAGHWLVRSPILEMPVLLTEAWPTFCSFKQLVAHCRRCGTTTPASMFGLGDRGYRVVESPTSRMLLPRHGRADSHPAEKIPPWAAQTPWCACSSPVNIVQSTRARLDQVLSGPVKILPKDLVGKTKAGKLVGLSTPTIYRWIEKGAIRTHGGKGEISLAELKEVVKSHPHRTLPDAIRGL